MSEQHIQKHRQVTLDSDLDKRVFDTAPISWQEIEDHPYVKAVEKLIKSETASDKVNAIETMLEKGRSHEVLRVETDYKVETKGIDEVRFENDRRVRQRGDKNLTDHSADHRTIKAVVSIEEALAAVGSLEISKRDPEYAHERENHHRVTEKLLQKLTDNEHPLLFTAADMALEHITLNQIDEHPEVFPELYSYATMLYSVPDSDNYIREDDNETNQEHAVWLMKKLVNHAERSYSLGKIGDQQVIDALGSKYDMLYAVELKASGNEQAAYDAVMEEQAIDNQSPFLKQANDIRRSDKLDLMVQMRQNMLNQHSKVVSPVVSNKLAF